MSGGPRPAEGLNILYKVVVLILILRFTSRISSILMRFDQIFRFLSMRHLPHSNQDFQKNATAVRFGDDEMMKWINSNV